MQHQHQMHAPGGMAPPMNAQNMQAALDKSDNDSATEHFLVYGYKVVPCSKRYRHDWSVCPFAHTGEMAARRDPSRYLPIFCFHSKQRLPCPRGDECPYSHNLFEYWLHPQRYRTEMCQFGAACTRPVCFFAHGEHQLRHTTMPGGPQPVVAPPEPIPALNGGFGSRGDMGAAAMDPAVKQQQQLMALQAAAAGFSQQQQQQQQQQQHAAATAVAVAAAAAGNSNVLPGVDSLGGDGRLHHVQSFPGMLDGNGMDAMASLQGQLSLAAAAGGHNVHHHMPASSPLSAPLPQLSPDVLAALQGMHGGGHHSAVSPMGGQLLHQHSGIPTPTRYEQQMPPGRLQRSMSSMAAHSGMNAGGAGAGSNNNLDDLTQQLAVMQLMNQQQQQQHGGGAAASGPLPDLNSRQMDHLLGYAHLQQQHSQHAAANAAASAGYDLAHLLPAATCGYAAHDTSLSCPLPPVYAVNNGGMCSGTAASMGSHSTDYTLAQHLQGMMPMAAVSCGLPRLPTPVGSSLGAPSSPGSDRSRDAPSPVGANGRDTQVPPPSKTGKPWSAPVSPCTSTGKGEHGNDLLPGPDDVKLSGFSAVRQSSSASSSSSSRHASDQQQQAAALGKAPSMGGDPPSFSAGVGASPAGLMSVGSGISSNGDSAPLLLVGDSPLEVAQVHAALAAVNGGSAHSHLQQEHDTIGHHKAAALLANMDEAAVAKLLALMQQGGVSGQ